MTTRIVMALIGVIALVTAINGFFKANDTPSAAEGFREERQRIVEASQLWFVRSAVDDGGDMSFDSLDFRRAGIAKSGNPMEYKGDYGNYKIDLRQRDFFVLNSTDFSGTVVKIDTLRFDTLP